MKLNRSTMEVLASILGLIIFVVVIMAAMNYFRQGTEEYTEAQRVAGRPITLAESISGSEALTETATAAGATTPVTDTAAVTTTEVAATAPLTAAVAVTTTSETTVTTSVTESTAVTDSAPIEVASAVTTTESTEVAAAPTVAPTAEPTVEPTVAPTVAPTAVPTVEPTAVPTEAAPAAAPAVAGVPAAADMVPIFTKGTCMACHVIPDIPGAVGVIGPNLTEIGAVGATRIPGYTAEQYIRESIVNPNAFIAPECPTGACLAGVMLQNLADILTPEELDLVVAYLAAQGVQ